MVNIFRFIFICFLTSVLSPFKITAVEIAGYLPVSGAKLRLGYGKSRQLSSKGKVLFLQGMGEFIEGNEILFNHLRDAGYDVYTFDWRGQGGSSRQTKRYSLCHINCFREHLNDLKAYIKSELKDEPFAVIANSMGGNLAVRYVIENPKAFQKIILIAPMLKIKTSFYPTPIAKLISTVIVGCGRGENFVFGFNTYTPAGCAHLFKYCGADRRIILCEILAKRPDLAIGGASFSWLKTALKSAEIVRDIGDLSYIKAPTLILSPEDDHLVNLQPQTVLCQKLANCRQQRLPHTTHAVLNGEPQAREMVFQDITHFLDLRQTS